MNTNRGTEHVQVAVIGAGQAGLSVGYCLAAQNVPFVILDANARVGDAWRQPLGLPSALHAGEIRWPGRDAVSGGAFSFPTKDEMADYVEIYARRFNLPVRASTRVERLWRDGTRYVIDAGRARDFTRGPRRRRDVLVSDAARARVRGRPRPRASCSCTPSITGIPGSFGRATSWSSARPIQARTSRWTSPRHIGRTCRGGIPGTSPFASRRAWRASSCRFSSVSSFTGF